MNVTMETMMELAVIFAILNAALLTALSVIYGRIVWRTRASHPIGLLIFALLLLLQNALTIYSYLAMAPFFPEESLPSLLGISALESASLLVLLRITL